MQSILLAFQFLTILPVGKGLTVEGNALARSSAWFVLVGLTQGFAMVATGYLGGMVFDPGLVTALILLVLVLSNGGFHLDALADTFDALAVKSTGDGSVDMQRRLSVMKGSTSGPAGVASIVFALGLEYLALRNIAGLSSFGCYGALLLMPVLPKWVMVVSMFHGEPARKEGLGNLFIEGTGPRELALSSALLVALLFSIPVFAGRFVPGGYFFFCAALLAVLYLAALLWNSLFRRKTGGLTGDAVGALGEISQITFLLMVIPWLRLSI
jgi:adenosylcobinamide-GDP ribazoletransferase